MPLEDRHQFLLGAVLYNANEDPITSFMESQNRDLTPGTTSSLASYSAGPEVALLARPDAEASVTASTSMSPAKGCISWKVISTNLSLIRE